MHDELIYFSENKAENLIKSNSAALGGLHVSKLKFDASVKIISSSLELSRSDQGQLISPAVSTVEDILSAVNGTNIEDYDEVMIPPSPGAVFHFSRLMAFGRAHHDLSKDLQAGYFVDAGRLQGKVRILMLGSIKHFLWSDDLDGNGNRSGSGTDSIWEWWKSDNPEKLVPLHGRQNERPYHRVYEDVARMMMDGSHRGAAYVTGYARILDSPYREVDPEHGQMIVASPFLVRYSSLPDRPPETSADRFERLNLLDRLKVAMRRKGIRQL